MEVYISLAFLSALSLTTLGVRLYRIDRQKEFVWFVPVMASAGVWAFFSALWLLLPAGLSMLMNKLSFLGIITLPVFLFLFAMHFAGRTWVFRRRVLQLFWFIPGVSILLMLTNELHGFFWAAAYPEFVFQDVPIDQYLPGFWYFIHSVYSYGLILVSIGVLFVALRKMGAIRWLYGLMVGIMVPLFTSILYFFGLTQLDYSPLVLSFAVLAFGWSITSWFYERNIQRLENLRGETDEMNRLYDLMVHISERLIQTKLENLDDAINDALAELGQFTGVDRVYIFDYDSENNLLNNTYEWCRQGINPEIENLQGIPLDFVPRWWDHFSRNEYIYIPSVQELPDEPLYEKEREILLPQGIKSLIVVPMFYSQSFRGFMGFYSVRALKIWDDKIIALLKMMADIITGSFLRIAYERALVNEKHNAEAANRAKTEFLANMSHELRTPLNAILGFSDLVARSVEDETHRRQLQLVLNSGHSLLRLLNDLLDFSKAEAGILQLHPTETNVVKVLDFVKDTFLPRAEEKGLDLRVRFGGNGDRFFLLDEGRLRQVLFNLVGNAIKFTHEGSVEVIAEVREAHGGVPGGGAEDSGGQKDCKLVFEIRDTGIGISEEEQETIFAAFTQVSTGIARQYEGTGLGLNISQRLVSLMGGTIDLVSTPGQGSVFTVNIPCR